MFLPGFGHISLNFHLIFQIVGSFSSQLVGIIYKQLIITALDLFKTWLIKTGPDQFFVVFLWSGPDF